MVLRVSWAATLLAVVGSAIVSIGAEVVSLEGEAQDPPPTFRVAVQCGTGRLRQAKGYDVVVTNQQGQVTEASWRHRKRFRGRPIVATSKKETRLLALGSRHYHIAVVKSDETAFSRSCVLRVGAGSLDSDILLGSVGVHRATAAAACKNHDGSVKAECSVWRAAELKCEHSACEMQPVNHIEHLEGYSPSDDDVGISLGDVSRENPTSVNGTTLQEVQEQLSEAKEKYVRAEADEAQYIRKLKQVLKMKDSNEGEIQRQLGLLQDLGVAVKKTIEKMLDAQNKVLRVKRDLYEHQAADNQTIADKEFDKGSRALKLALSSKAAETARGANLSLTIRKDKKELEQYSKLMGEAEAGLKVAQQQRKVFVSEQTMQQEQVKWLNRDFRQAKERLDRMRVEAEKWAVQVKAASDPHERKQMRLKLDVANSMAKTAQARLKVFGSKLKEAQKSVVATSADIQDMALQIKEAKQSWSETEYQWEQTFRHLKKQEMRRIELQKTQWQAELDLAHEEQKMIMAKQLNSSSSRVFDADEAVERSTYALSNANIMIKYYKGQLFRLESSAKIGEGKFQEAVRAAAAAGAKAKAASIALTTAEAESLEIAKQVKQENDIERNSRQAAVLRAHEVDKLTKQVKSAAKQKEQLGRVDLDSLQSAGNNSKPTRENPANADQLEILKFKLNKAQEATVDAVKQAHLYQKDKGAGEKKLAKLRLVVEKYKKIYHTESEVAQKAQAVLAEATQKRDTIAASMAAIGKGLKKATAEASKVKLLLRSKQAKRQMVDTKTAQEDCKAQSTNALSIAKEAGEKRAVAQGQQAMLLKRIEHLKKQGIHQARLQASAHAEGHTCLVRLQKVKEQMSGLKSERLSLNSEIETASASLTKQDDAIGELMIQVKSETQPDAEDKLQAELSKTQVKNNNLQQHLTELFHRSKHAKEEALKLGFEVSARESDLAKSLAQSREAKAMQKLNDAVLKSQMDAAKELEKYILRMTSRATKHKHVATKLMLQAADNALQQDEGQKKLAYVQAATALKAEKASGNQYDRELSKLIQEIGHLRQKFSSHVQKEKQDEAKAQHLLLGASDSQFVVQQNEEQRDTIASKINHLRKELMQQDQIISHSMKQKQELQQREMLLKDLNEKLVTRKRQEMLNLPIYEMELSHAQKRLAVAKNATKDIKPPAQSVLLRSELQETLAQAKNRIEKKNAVREDELRSEDMVEKDGVQKAQSRYERSRSFWKNAREHLFRVQSRARANLHGLEISYNHSVMKASQAEQEAGVAIDRIGSKSEPSQDMKDLEVALREAKMEATNVKASSEGMITKALDLVAAQEMDLLSRGHKNLTEQAVRGTAIKAMNLAHSHLKHLREFTIKLESARDLWKTAESTTKHAIVLAHNVMQANLELLEKAQSAETDAEIKAKNAVTADKSQMNNVTNNFDTTLQALDRNISQALKFKINRKLAPYRMQAKQKSETVRAIKERMKSLNFQLDQLAEETAKNAITRKFLDQKLSATLAQKNTTMAQISVKSREEEEAENAVHLAQKRATSLAQQGNSEMGASKTEKVKAEKAQHGLKQDYNERGELLHDLSTLESTEKNDESSFIGTLAKWKLATAVRKQAPLLMQVALLATTSHAAFSKAAQEAELMRTSLTALNATIMKQDEFQKKCSATRGQLKADEFGVELSERDQVNYKALQSEDAALATTTSDSKRQHSSGPRERSEKQLVQQKHKVVLTKLQMFAACKWTTELKLQSKELQDKIVASEDEVIIQHKRSQSQIHKAGMLQQQAAKFAADSKMSVIKTALKMSTSAKMAAVSSSKQKQAQVSQMVTTLSKTTQVLRRKTLHTLVVASKCATLNDPTPEAITTWEQQCAAADMTESEAELNVILKANELLSVTPALKQAYGLVEFSSKEEFNAASTLADAKLAADATAIKMRESTTVNLAHAFKSATRSYNSLISEIKKIQDRVSEEVEQSASNKKKNMEIKTEAISKKKVVNQELLGLQRKYSNAAVRLNSIRNKANFWVKAIKASGKATKASKQLPGNFEEEVRLQKEKLRDITHKKITASDHLQKVVSQAFLADAAISESETSQDGAKALQAFASAAMSKLKQSIEKSKAYIDKYAATKKSFRKSAYKLLLWHKKVVAKALQDSVTIQHESLSLESEFATSVFNIQRKLMKQAATKYRVLKAREKLMLKLAKFYENKAQTLKNSVIKNTEVAKAEKIASGGATLAEFQDASAKAQGSTKIDSKLKRETAIIAIMDAAQQTAKAKRAELNKKHKTALELATRFTTAAQAVNAKFPVAVARLRQGTINAKKAKSYAQKVLERLHKVAKEHRKFHKG